MRTSLHLSALLVALFLAGCTTPNTVIIGWTVTGTDVGTSSVTPSASEAISAARARQVPVNDHYVRETPSWRVPMRRNPQ